MKKNTPESPAKFSAVCECDLNHGDLIERVRNKMPKDEDFYDLADLYKMFSDSTRVRILWALSCEEMCVCDITLLLGMTKSAISHQLRALRLANLVKYSKHGKEVYYSLADDHVKDIFEKGFEHIRE
ncbi:MAG: metalloregulator ArsR/SmtB family transcription factor [Treponema sp.]|nr:metalloregulator ArsR/SmtB family transcription factor [Treponema sp.]